MDELADAAGPDPAEFRLSTLDGVGDNHGAKRLARRCAPLRDLSYGTKVLPKA
jgi:hypothetical protein